MSVIIFAALFWLLNAFLQPYKKLKYILLLFFFVCFFLPLQEYSLYSLLYSFFDAPSLFSIALALLFSFQNLAKDFNISLFEALKKNKSLVFTLIFSTHCILYLSLLNFITFNLYYANYALQALFLFLFLVLLFCLNAYYALLALICLLAFVLGFESLFETLFDIYLFIFSFFVMICAFKEKICKRK